MGKTGTRNFPAATAMIAGIGAALSARGRSLLAALVAVAVSLAVASPALAAAGDLDPSFDGDGKVTTSFGDEARDVAIQPDGKIVVAGPENPDFALTRYNPDGSLDTTFGNGGTVTTDFALGGGTDNLNAISLQTDGKIVAVGSARKSDGTPDFAAARYNPDGALDATFGNGGKVTTNLLSVANDVAIQTDGKIVAAGTAGNDFAVVRLDPDGSLDAAFDTDGAVTTSFGMFDEGSAVALQPDGEIVVAGVADNADFALARYTANGSLDTTFDTDGKVTTDFSGFDQVNGVAIQQDGKIVAAGFSGNGDFALARYNANGSLDTNFSDDGKATTDFGATDSGNDVALQPDGKIVVAGATGTSDPITSLFTSDFALARYDTNGNLDATFGNGGTVITDFGGFDVARALALQTDGKIVAAGGSGGGFALARYLADPPNRAPVANNDPYSVREDETLTVDAPGVLTNDTDADSDTLTARLVTGPDNAAQDGFTFDSDGSFDYTPKPDFNGSDAFTYKAGDGEADSNVATVVISVRAANDAPTANDDAEQTERNTPKNLDVLYNDFDIDGDRLTVTGADSPTTEGATTTVLANNKIRYTPPDEDFVGADTFDYTIADPSGQTDTATVTVEVGDTGAPSVVGVSPINARNTADAGANVEATFSEKIDPNSLDETTFTLVKDGESAPVAATITLDSTGKKAILDPDGVLESGAIYTATVEGGAGGVADPSGNELVADEVWFFSVNSAPEIANPKPAHNSKTSKRAPAITATATDAQTDLTSNDIGLSLDGKGITGFTYNRHTDRLKFVPERKLSIGRHEVEVSAEDAQGLATTRTWSFRVVKRR